MSFYAFSSVVYYLLDYIVLSFSYIPFKLYFNFNKKLLMRNHIYIFQDNAEKLHSMRTIIVSIEFTTVEHKWMELWNLGG